MCQLGMPPHSSADVCKAAERQCASREDSIMFLLLMFAVMKLTED